MRVKKPKPRSEYSMRTKLRCQGLISPLSLSITFLLLIAMERQSARDTRPETRNELDHLRPAEVATKLVRLV